LDRAAFSLGLFSSPPGRGARKGGSRHENSGSLPPPSPFPPFLVLRGFKSFSLFSDESRPNHTRGRTGGAALPPFLFFFRSLFKRVGRSVFGFFFFFPPLPSHGRGPKKKVHMLLEDGRPSLLFFFFSPLSLSFPPYLRCFFFFGFFFFFFFLSFLRAAGDVVSGGRGKVVAVLPLLFFSPPDCPLRPSANLSNFFLFPFPVGGFGRERVGKAGEKVAARALFPFLFSLLSPSDWLRRTALRFFSFSPRSRSRAEGVGASGPFLSPLLPFFFPFLRLQRQFGPACSFFPFFLLVRIMFEQVRVRLSAPLPPLFFSAHGHALVFFFFSQLHREAARNTTFFLPADPPSPFLSQRRACSTSVGRRANLSFFSFFSRSFDEA